jgi:hypothetical protein
MTVANQIEQFTYAVGEEVVCTLAHGEAIDLGRGTPLAATCVPAWTIGVIVGHAPREGAASYVVRFRHHDATCLAVVGEEQIEGTA